MTYGKLAAIMHALDARGTADAMPYASPQGVDGSSAYVLDLAAQTKTGQESTLRGIAALGLLDLAAVAGTFLRRRQGSLAL